MDAEDDDSLLGYGCPVCLCMRTSGVVPARCEGCGLVLGESVMLGFLDVSAEAGEGLGINVTIRPLLRGAWTPAAEAVITEAFGEWRDGMLGTLA